MLYSQTHKAIYSFKMEKNPTTGSTELSDSVNELSELNSLIVYFNTKHSYYTSQNTELGNPNLSDALAGTYYPLKYDIEERKFLYNHQFDKLYCVEDNYLPLWEITSESKNISGFDCLKAVGKLKKGDENYTYIEAWFTPEITYNVGPNFFVDLPGLIIYLVDRNQFIYKLESIEFNNNTINPSDINFEGTLIDYEKYSKLMEM